MAEHLFFGKRAGYLLSEQLDFYDKGENNTREVGLMLRYHSASDHGYYRALNELRKLQKERRLQEIGFVPQNAPQPADAPSESAPQPAPGAQKSPVVPFPPVAAGPNMPSTDPIEVKIDLPKAA
jgi:hypothetical protein